MLLLTFRIHFCTRIFGEVYYARTKHSTIRHTYFQEPRHKVNLFVFLFLLQVTQFNQSMMSPGQDHHQHLWCSL